jgi:hypothetical protein
VRALVVLLILLQVASAAMIVKPPPGWTPLGNEFVQQMRDKGLYPFYAGNCPEHGINAVIVQSRDSTPDAKTMVAGFINGINKSGGEVISREEISFSGRPTVYLTGTAAAQGGVKLGMVALIVSDNDFGYTIRIQGVSGLAMNSPGVGEFLGGLSFSGSEASKDVIEAGVFDDARKTGALLAGLVAMSVSVWVILRRRSKRLKTQDFARGRASKRLEPIEESSPGNLRARLNSSLLLGATTPRAGGPAEISRWCSEARAEPPDSRPTDNWRAGGAREPSAHGLDAPRAPLPSRLHHQEP